MAWSWDGRVIHGMQEVWGSNPHSSTAGQTRNSNAETMSRRPLRGILKGEICPQDGSLLSIGAALGQVGGTAGALVMCKRS